MVLPSHSYGMSPAIWDHIVLPATQPKWTRSTLTPASKLVLNLPTPEGWKAELSWVDLGNLALHRPGTKLTISWSQVRRPNQPLHHRATYMCLCLSCAGNWPSTWYGRHRTNGTCCWELQSCLWSELKCFICRCSTCSNGKIYSSYCHKLLWVFLDYYGIN